MQIAETISAGRGIIHFASLEDRQIQAETAGGRGSFTKKEPQKKLCRIRWRVKGRGDLCHIRPDQIPEIKRRFYIGKYGGEGKRISMRRIFFFKKRPCIELGFPLGLFRL